MNPSANTSMQKRLYGTASEHAVFYQYNFHKAANIFAGLLQTESPYFQPSPAAPAPFADVVGKFAGDPDYSCAAGNEFNGCNESWAVIVRQSQNIIVASTGLYSWFLSYGKSCIDGHTCQKALLYLDSNRANARFQNLVTIGAKYMAVMDSKGISALANLNVDKHPSWSQISILDVHSSTACSSTRSSGSTQKSGRWTSRRSRVRLHVTLKSRHGLAPPAR